MPVTTSSAADNRFVCRHGTLFAHRWDLNNSGRQTPCEHNSSSQASKAGQDRHKAGVNHPAPLAATACRWDISGALAPSIKDSPLYLLEQSDSRSALDPQPLQLCVKGYTALHSTLCFVVMEQGPAVPFPAHLIAPYPGLLPTLNTHQDTLHCPLGHAEPCHIQEEMWWGLSPGASHKKTPTYWLLPMFEIWSSGEQHRASWDHHSMVWAETLPLLSFLNHPVCSLTTLLKCIWLPIFGHYISIKMVTLPSCAYTFCPGAKAAPKHCTSLKWLSQEKSTYFQHSYFSATPSTPNLLPKEISILWCGRSCIYYQVIFDHCVNLSPANISGRQQGEKRIHCEAIIGPRG